MDAVTRRSNAFSKALATVLRGLREEKNLSQLELASRAGISNQYVGYIERELRRPTVETLARLAIALDCPVSDICKRTEELLSKKS